MEAGKNNQPDSVQSMSAIALPQNCHASAQVQARTFQSFSESEAAYITKVAVDFNLLTMTEACYLS